MEQISLRKEQRFFKASPYPLKLSFIASIAAHLHRVLVAIL